WLAAGRVGDPDLAVTLRQLDVHLAGDDRRAVDLEADETERRPRRDEERCHSGNRQGADQMDDTTRDNTAAMSAIQKAVQQNSAAVERLADRVERLDEK